MGGSQGGAPAGGGQFGPADGKRAEAVRQAPFEAHFDHSLIPAYTLLQVRELEAAKQRAQLLEEVFMRLFNRLKAWHVKRADPFSLPLLGQQETALFADTLVRNMWGCPVTNVGFPDKFGFTLMKLSEFSTGLIVRWLGELSKMEPIRGWDYKRQLVLSEDQTNSLMRACLCEGHFFAAMDFADLEDLPAFEHAAGLLGFYTERLVDFVGVKNFEREVGALTPPPPPSLPPPSSSSPPPHLLPLSPSSLQITTWTDKFSREGKSLGKSRTKEVYTFKLTSVGLSTAPMKVLYTMHRARCPVLMPSSNESPPIKAGFAVTFDGELVSADGKAGGKPSQAGKGKAGGAKGGAKGAAKGTGGPSVDKQFIQLRLAFQVGY
jgi:hypothetical protein